MRKMGHRAVAVFVAIMIGGVGPARATTYQVVVQSDGTFVPKYLSIVSGDTVEWVLHDRSDAIARVTPVDIGAGGQVLPWIDTADACFVPNAADPAYVNPFRRAYDGVDPEEPTGPTRHGVSGIWALGPEGGAVGKIEIPSAEAELITPGILAADGCALLNHPENDAVVGSVMIKHRFLQNDAESGSGANAVLVSGDVVDVDGIQRVLCKAATLECDVNGDDCKTIEVDPARPETIPPHTYPNGLLTSTYENPDITGVVLRFNWRDLQYDDGAGNILERWEHLDRELERAVASGKLVTLDVRAGMFGTPDWIFDDYLLHDSDHAAPWCTAAGCAFTTAHASAGQVEPLEFMDHYDEDPPGDGCGTLMRIGSPGDLHYRALYKDFIARLAAHVATDTRWFQAIAHVKVSGANLQTSEAELPHHCDDLYTNTADHHIDPKSTYAHPDGDRVLDVFKTLDGVEKKTQACICNPEVWHAAGYVPEDLYGYYAEVEQQIVTSFFGKKSLGYQIIQDGFPRADATGSFFGDHLYRETLVAPAAEPLGAHVNAGLEDGDVCVTPSVDAVSFLPEVEEDTVAGTHAYCSDDTSLAGDHISLRLTPVADPLATIAPYADAENSAGRYPTAFEQSQAVLDQSGDGRFMDPAIPTHVDRRAGRLFVPQHSGIQPMPQERLELGYADEDSIECLQEQPMIDTALAGWPQEITDRVGGVVAAFPMPEATAVSELSDPDTNGCPNRWIVAEGKDQDSWFVQWPFGGMIEIEAPPQLTGFQVVNKVRSAAHVESALVNLVHNTNGVFMELYEDSIWQIARTRGTGPTALPIDDLVVPERLAAGTCVTGVTCYTKNLAQWAEELHLRRFAAADLWSTYQGTTYRALENPFPFVHRQTFTVLATELVAYINPAFCDPLAVDLGPKNDGAPSALGVIKITP